MSKNVRRRGRKLARRKRGNWFTRMRTWQKVLLCFAGGFCLSVGNSSDLCGGKME